MFINWKSIALLKNQCNNTFVSELRGIGGEAPQPPPGGFAPQTPETGTKPLFSEVHILGQEPKGTSPKFFKKSLVSDSASPLPTSKSCILHGRGKESFGQVTLGANGRKLLTYKEEK